MDESMKDSRKYLVAIRDAKTGVFGPVVTVLSVEEAERMFGDLCTDKSCQVGRHPEDFSLFELGRYEETTGTIYAVFNIVCNGVDFQRKE